MPLRPEPGPGKPEFAFGGFDEAREEFGELPVVTEADFLDRVVAAHHDLVGNVGHEAAVRFFDRVRQLHTNR